MSQINIDQSWYKKPIGISESQSAGGIVIRVENKQHLIALVRENGYSDYVLPKGHIETGETIEQAAQREIEEEAGLSQIVLVCKLAETGRLSFDKREWKTVHFFLYKTSQKTGIPTDSYQHYNNTEWFPVTKLPPMLWPEQKKLIEDNIDKIKQLR